MVNNYRLGTHVQRFVHTRIKSVVVTLRYICPLHLHPI